MCLKILRPDSCFRKKASGLRMTGGEAKFAKRFNLGYNLDVAVLSYGGDWFRLVLVGYRSRVEEAW